MGDAQHGTGALASRRGAKITCKPRPSQSCRAWLPVAETVEETAEDAAFAGKGWGGCGRVGALAGDGLVVVGPDNGVNDAGLIKVLRAFDPGHVADKHAVAHNLGFQAGRAVSVPLGFAAARQRHAHAELADAAAEEVSVDATVTEGVDNTAGPEFVHTKKVMLIPERSLNATCRAQDMRARQWTAELNEHGLLRPSFIPAAEVAALRQRTKCRRMLIEPRASEPERLAKVLEDGRVRSTLCLPA